MSVFLEYQRWKNDMHIAPSSSNFRKVRLDISSTDTKRENSIPRPERLLEQ